MTSRDRTTAGDAWWGWGVINDGAMERALNRALERDGVKVAVWAERRLART
ncbi:hypothetical protein [Okeania sp. SIO2G5]|uniref:hypothetical protein n=1 Tax=Okeania sp. SIO2G5 TaxID=2607796 RepID=UPI0013C0CC57|nr:hypothetical protein [Okeania sp. SIO2G5]NEP76701.1 hypothetical protein [Okeania sp. SIO2G5]